jgi:hypothetical protein
VFAKELLSAQAAGSARLPVDADVVVLRQRARVGHVAPRIPSLEPVLGSGATIAAYEEAGKAVAEQGDSRVAPNLAPCRPGSRDVVARQRLCGRNGTYPQKSVSEGQRFHDVSMSEGCCRLAADELTTIRERLIKFGARVIEQVARIRIHLPTS